jgi:omega-6 fatty acid desaturase (delta-12 desaturase)
LNSGQNTSASPDALKLMQTLSGYRQPNHTRSAFELAITAFPLIALWGAAWFAYSTGYWWASLLIAIPAGGFMVRLFVIQHDCGHGSFFAYKWANDWVGRTLGIFTLTPYDFWRRTHALHHSTSGNLDKRGIGDVDTLTVREFRALSRWGRLRYRAYRNPLVMFGFGPAYLFLLQHRLPIGLMRSGWLPWVSTQATNAAIALFAAGLIWLVGVQAFFLVHLPIMLVAASLGVWLFYVQHQFENTSWSNDGSWTFQEAALQGSSYYDLPIVLHWITANIGVHHVHHVCSRIPYYRLQRVLKDHPDLRNIGRLTMLQSLACVRLALWDEDRKRLISFRDASSAK